MARLLTKEHRSPLDATTGYAVGCTPKLLRLLRGSQKNDATSNILTLANMGDGADSLSLAANLCHWVGIEGRFHENDQV